MHMNFSVGGGEDTVNEELCSGEIGGFGTDVMGILNFVAAHSPANAMRVDFFGSHGGNDAEIRGFATLGNGGDRNKIDSVGALCLLVSLGETTDFFAIGF